MRSNGWSKPPTFNRYKIFGHDNLSAKHCYFMCSMRHVVNGIKNFDKDDLAIKCYSFYIDVCDLVILIKNFDLINIRRSRAPEIMFSNEVIMTKPLIHTYQKKGLSCPFDFTFLNQAHASRRLVNA